MVYSRRKFLTHSLLAIGGVMAAPALVRPAVAVNNAVRKVSFRNMHTGESFSGIYKVGDHYLPDAFEQINYVLRDFRSGDVFPMDPQLIDLLSTLHGRIGGDEPFEILSGYRSPKTNARLRRASTGVAKNSLHMKGMATDIRLPEHSTAELRRQAIALKTGGVGYYPRSNFVHVDTGRFRTW